jgi:uncharacterized membrane protein
MLSRIVTLAALGAAALVVRNNMKRQTSPDGRLSGYSESLDVDVPVSTAYNQWTQFEEFPKFMAGVLEVRQLDDTRQHWRARIGGKEEGWDAEITRQIPDQLIAWRSTSGPRNEGMVMFQRLSEDRTRIELRMYYEPQTLVERMGDAMGAVSMRVGGNLRRFKEFIEHRGTETGAWRGTVDAPGDARPGGPTPGL